LYSLKLIFIVFSSTYQGTKATVICAKENEESHPHAQQTYKVMSNTEMETSLPSSTNTAQSSEYEETESGMSFEHSLILSTIQNVLLPCLENILNNIFLMLLFFIHFISVCLF
jgi:hypothetical protein